MSAAVVEYDPLQDVRHLRARSARELADWKAWLEVEEKAPRTLDAYERTIAALLVMFPRHEIGDFTDGDLLHFLTTFPKKSRRIRKAHIASFFSWARKTRRIASNPVELLPTIKRHPQPVIDIFTPTEQAALEGLASPDGNLMSLLFWAGLRKLEAINLRSKRIDLDNRLIIVREGAKGSRDRVVPIVKPLRVPLAELLLLEGIDDEDYLWYDKPGGGWSTTVRRSKPIAETSFGRWWTRCIETADVDYRKPHTCRHTCATNLRRMGYELDRLKRFLGHSSISITEGLYVHTTVSEDADRLDMLFEVQA